MSIPKISGQQARELLELPDSAAPWKIEQRNLAETVAWLYGREPEHPDMGIHSVPLTRFSGNDADVVYAAKGGVIVFDVDGGFRSIEEAEDFARAVLAVVEESRREARP